MKTFRNRIRYSAVGLLAALLITFNVFVYWGFNTLAQQYMDARLYGLADTLSELFEERPKLLLASEREIVTQQGTRSPRAKEELRAVLHSVQVLSLDGTLVWKGVDVIQRQPAAKPVLEQVGQGEIAYETVHKSPDSSVRRILVPIRQDGEVRFALQAEASLGFFEKTHRNLMSLLLLGSVFVVAVAWVGSGRVARQVLLPVETLNRTAEVISESSLRNRVSLDVPYEEFRRLAQAFNGMLDRLRKAYESQRHFVDDAAHEIQTPLTVIQGNLEWALQKPRTGEEYREVLSTSLMHVARLIALAKSLLMLARFGGDSPPVHLVPLALEPLLRDLVEDLRPLAEDRALRLSLQVEAAPPVLGDAERLKQLLINLLDNAFRYTAPGGAVTVRLSCAHDRVVLAVEDTGQGIQPDDLPHMFERFYRSPTTGAGNPDSVGLGLAIVKEIAEAHKGVVTVESQVGKGSAFRLALPALTS